MKMVYNIKDKPTFGKLIIFAFQQLLAIMAATIAVPMIIGNGMSTSAALFGAGVGTLVYLGFTLMKSPVFLGSSFAFLGSMATAFAGAASVGLGYVGLIIGAVLAGLVYVVIAIIIKFVGSKWIYKIMPAVVIGPVVAIIGLSLAGNAVGDLQTPSYTQTLDANEYAIVEVDKTYTTPDGEFSFLASDMGENIAPSYAVINEDGSINENITVALNEDGTFNVTTKPGSPYVAIICGIITLLTVMICSVYGNKMGKMIPFIIGILAGYVACSIFYVIGALTGNHALQVIDYSAITNTFREVNFSSFISVPDFTFIKAFGSIGELTPAYFGTVAVAYIPVAMVVFAEHVADHRNLSSIIDKDLLYVPTKEEIKQKSDVGPGLHRTLLGDGIGSMVGAFFGGCPNTTYGESVGCVAITKNASTITILVTAIEAILISFITPFVAFLSTIPNCVMGGVCIALYGFIAVSGLKMLQKVDLDKNRNLFTASVILIAGIGGLSLTFGSVTITAIATALILGILVNVILSGKDKKEKNKETENE